MTVITHPLRDLHERALLVLETLNGSPTMSWLGTVYPCIPSTLERGTRIDWGGRIVEIKLSLTVRASVLAGAAQPLAAGKTLSYAGEVYRIAVTRVSSPGDHIKVVLIDANV